jgi:hypothetical protein
MNFACDASEEDEVTTPTFDEAEKAAWRVAVDRGLPITATDLRRMIDAAKSHFEQPVVKVTVSRDVSISEIEAIVRNLLRNERQVRT